MHSRSKDRRSCRHSAGETRAMEDMVVYFAPSREGIIPIVVTDNKTSFLSTALCLLLSALVPDVDTPARRKVETKAEPQKGNPESRETEAPSARRDATGTPRLSRRLSRSSARLYVCTIELDFLSNWPSWFSFRSRSSPPFAGSFSPFPEWHLHSAFQVDAPFFRAPSRSLLRRQAQVRYFPVHT